MKKKKRKYHSKAKRKYSGLSHRHRVFCIEYLLDGNAKRAYVAAGFKSQGNAAEAAASRLLRNVKVKRFLESRHNAILAELEINVKKTLRELALIGFANMQDYVRYSNNNVELIASDKLTRDQMAAIHEVSKTEIKKDVVRTTFKLSDKVAALAKIGEHLKMFTQKHEVSGDYDKLVERAVFETPAFAPPGAAAPPHQK